MENVSLFSFNISFGNYSFCSAVVAAYFIPELLSNELT